jgi:hypothetical protein
MPEWLMIVLGFVGAGVVALLCYELINGGTKTQQSGCAWMLLLAFGSVVVVLAGAMLSGAASILSTDWGKWILVAAFLAMGWFGFFSKLKK